MKKNVLITVTAIAGIGMAGCFLGGLYAVGKTADTVDAALASSSPVVVTSVSPSAQPTPAVTSASPTPVAVVTTKAAPPPPVVTVSQQNAVNLAEQYIENMAFSKTGLIHQLKYEGFSTADATYGATHITVNWTEQADRMAAQYLENMSFSYSGLVHQLKYEGFTTAQAEHGAKSVGL